MQPPNGIVGITSKNSMALLSVNIVEGIDRDRLLTVTSGIVVVAAIYTIA